MQRLYEHGLLSELEFEDPEELEKTAKELNLIELSMGMSADFESAIIEGSTYLRLGTAILGERNSK